MMRLGVSVLLSGVFLACSSAFAQSGELPVAASRDVDFVRDVQPLLRQRCVGCHGPGQQMSGLRLDQKSAALKGGYSGPVIKPGASADSILIHRVAGLHDVGVMPPAGKRLTAEEIGVLRAWIDRGANWPERSTAGTEPSATAAKRQSHWAFQPVRRPTIPTVQASGWVRNPIDAFILSRLEREKLSPSPEAERATLLRRVSLDLTGIPPTPQAIEAFLKDRRPDAYERLVDQLLQSPHYGEKFARHWLDLARYADSDGYEKDWVRPYAWRYRDWVIQAFNRDLPFDQFTIDQIAGDLLPNATVEQKVATGFHRNTLINREGGVDNNQFRFETTVDRANTVSTVWLGLTVGCAQCHDHKYDPISQKDHYQMFAFFDNVEEEDIDAPLPGELEPYLRTKAEYRAKREALLNEYNVPELQRDWEKRIQEAGANPGKWLDWDLAWDCLLKLTEGGDGEKIIRIPPDQRTERQRDVLTTHFVRNYHFAIGPKRYGEVRFKELDTKLTELKNKYPQLTQAMTVAEAPAAHPSFLRVRGNYKTNGIEVKPAVLTVLPQLTAQPDRLPTRLDLARWIVSDENPLTARVAVNRLWQELFGQGLVRSSDDFGTRGDKPSHPELLDWLASEYRQQGWSTKKMVRLIVTSATYRQASRIRPELQSTDPNNVLLARQSRLRLPAELIRDSALAASGLISLEVGGKSIRPPQPAGVTSLGYGKKDDSAWVESQGKDRYRRGLYIFFQRSTPYPQLVNFDAPKAAVAVCRRERSNTPLQALNLLNDPVFMDAAKALASAASSVATDFDGRLENAFLRVVGRGPTAREKEQFRVYFERQKKILESDAAAVSELAPSGGSGEDRAAAATWVALSSVLLNLDEFLTRE